MTTLLALILLVFQPAPLTDAIWAVETSRAPDYKAERGDGGKALGPLQCHEDAWIDAEMPTGTWQSCETLEYSEQVFKRYTDRWAGKDASDEQRARCWNSGPKWREKLKKTDGYWLRVKKELAG